MAPATPAPQSPASPQAAADSNATIAKLKIAIFDAFAVTHIAEALVDYDTDSDDGALQVHPFACTDENGQPVSCPEVSLAEPLAFDPSDAPKSGRPLDDAIFALVYLLLEQEPCLWAGEDGALGKVRFPAATRLIEVEHTRRFVKHETHTRAF